MGRDPLLQLSKVRTRVTALPDGRRRSGFGTDILLVLRSACMESARKAPSRPHTPRHAPLGESDRRRLR
jgi:hypothetical protein